MLMMTMMTLITLMLTIILMVLSLTLSKKTIIDREKNSPFECGFDPKSPARMPFSLRFFLIAVIFLIFDVEIALILPIIITMNFSNPMTWMITLTLFILILLLGLYHEWHQGALDWAM
uniref:NADH-ubiquinone oxidoreductase chain 3 n=1 Tax=Pseudolebinthus lunipterus TaxID=2681891 RepID=A0A650BWM4_9ORTH|nr:NADH dehydrogenase subunit 3 [Pseudolebinthus sp. 1 RN-2019]